MAPLAPATTASRLKGEENAALIELGDYKTAIADAEKLNALLGDAGDAGLRASQ